MGIDYTYKLVYGFELDEEDVLAPFQHTKKTEGEFHMEDRFDPKTGAKLPAVKVWDKKPTSERWYEVDGKKYDDLDPEEWDSILEEKFGCFVEQMGSFPSGELTRIFHVNQSMNWKDADDYGRITVFNNAMSATLLKELEPKANELKTKLQAFGYEVSEPQVFIATRIS
jgi:hypothetical protein